MNEKRKPKKSVVYYKPTCVTCKRTISEFERLNKDIEKRDFFKEPFSERELEKIIKMTGISPKEMLRKRDKKYKELKVDKMTDAEIIKKMVKNPGLIRRPIVLTEGKALVGNVDPSKV